MKIDNNFQEYLIQEFKDTKKSIDETKKSVDEVKVLIHEKFDHEKEYNYKTFISSKTFYWIMGIVIVGIITLTGFTSSIKVDITKMKEQHRIENLDE